MMKIETEKKISSECKDVICLASDDGPEKGEA